MVEFIVAAGLFVLKFAAPPALAAGSALAWRLVRKVLAYFRDLRCAIDHIGNTQMAITDVLVEPILFADRTGECVYVNRAFEKMVGYSRAEMVERGWLSALHTSCRDRIREAWEEAVHDGRLFNEAASFKHRDGRRVETTMTASTIGRATVDGWLIVFQPDALRVAR